MAGMAGFSEDDLIENATCKDYLQVRKEGAWQVERLLRHYNLAVEFRAGDRQSISMMKYASSPGWICVSSY